MRWWRRCRRCHWCAGPHWPRRRTLLLTLISLTASQLISALAPTFAVLAAGRVLCALTHRLMWSVVAPIGARLVPATHAARATTAVYVGTGFALVVGSPLTAALSQMWGWRLAVVAICGGRRRRPGGRPVHPAADGDDGGRPDRRRAPTRRHHQNRRLVIMCALTLVGVTGHFISYAFIVVIISDIVGISGPNLAWLLAGRSAVCWRWDCWPGRATAAPRPRSWPAWPG